MKIPRSFRITFHRIIFARLGLLVSLIGAVVLLGNAISGQEFKEVHPGVEHAAVEHRIGTEPVKINLLRLDLSKVRLDVKLGMDTVVGTETTSSIARRHRAVAAINSGFFRLDSSIFAGDPAGALKIDGEVLSEPDRDRSVIFIDNRRDRTLVEFVHLRTKRTVEIRGREFNVDGINRERRDNELVVFTPAFHRTTLTGPDGVEAIVRNGRITAILNGVGSSVIPADGLVLSASGTARNEMMRTLRIGDRVRMFAAVQPVGDEVLPPAIFNYEDHTNGVSMLVKDGAKSLTWEAERAPKSFAEARHPRTAVAKLKDRRVLFVTVDGRQPGVSVGMTLPELADYLLTVGAVDAINLDGGGSTTMVLDGRVVNTPSDPNGERKVGDAIVVTLR